MQENVAQSFCYESRSHKLWTTAFCAAHVIFLGIIAAWPCALDTGCCGEQICPKTAENRLKLQRCRTEHLSTVGTRRNRLLLMGLSKTK